MNIYIELSGGMGNQLFQYAQFLDLRRENQIDKTYLYYPRLSGRLISKNNIEINKVLNKSPGVCSNGFIEMAFYIGRKLGSKHFATYQDNWWGSSGDFTASNYDANSNVLVRSLFQRIPKDRTLEEISENFKGIRIEDERFNCRLYAAIHVRLGDYITSEKARNEIGPMSSNYYINILNEIRAISADMPVYIISNGTVEQVTKLFKGLVSKRDIINNMTDIESFEILRRAHILGITNSTFSLWSAYLGNASTVLCPPRWVANSHSPRSVKILYKNDWKILSE